MTQVTTLAELEALYGTPDPNSMAKVAQHITPEYAAWIEASRFVILSTVGSEGTDASPRGDDGPAVRIADETTLMMPDWRGNNRTDSLRNIVEDGRCSLMFIVSGKTNVMRANGRAVVSVDPDLLDSFARDGATRRHLPRSVIVMTIDEIYSQCARALIRAEVWTRDDADLPLPTPGDILKAQTRGAVDGATYDANWASRAQETMWSNPK
ncbi:MAG: pyridoxamine 5'-phosphate oxidase family protein [Pseudomonadota bacterium]